MLWLTRTSERKTESDTFTQDSVERQYLVMKEIAETIYSPIGVLDFAGQIVFAYDVDKMTLNPAGITLRIGSLTC